MIIRSARDSDGPAITNLWEKLLEEQHGLDPRFAASDDATERWLNDFREWVEAPDVHRISVAELDGVIVGFVSAQLWWPPPVYEQILEVYLDELFVETSHRRQGIGSKLLDDILEWTRTLEVTRVRLGTLANNQEAIDFWKKRGASEFLVALLLDT